MENKQEYEQYRMLSKGAQMLIKTDYNGVGKIQYLLGS